MAVGGAGAAIPVAMAQSQRGPLEVLAVGDVKTLTRPCVDCGLITGSFCDGDGCFAKTRDPDSHWAPGQRTPLCTACDDKHDGLCNYCRKMAWAAPAPRRGQPQRPTSN